MSPSVGDRPASGGERQTDTDRESLCNRHSFAGVNFLKRIASRATRRKGFGFQMTTA